MIKILFLLLPMIYTLAVNSAEYYSWTDENGVTHFSRTPPQSKKFNLIKEKKHRSKVTQLTPPRKLRQTNGKKLL